MQWQLQRFRNVTSNIEGKISKGLPLVTIGVTSRWIPSRSNLARGLVAEALVYRHINREASGMGPG